ncbi:hypothetical protein [Tateyamaria sp. SN6-1]|uniref:hypothetical protein n=1 Tax=Tateyamaria sp. SN6-1 TaxID=3092148 RepID=UPI0039F5735F
MFGYPMLGLDLMIEMVATVPMSGSFGTVLMDIPGSSASQATARAVFVTLFIPATRPNVSLSHA